MARKVGNENLTAGLNDAQHEAVCYGDGPLLVLAGAGSGKTRVITYRIAYLLKQRVSPKRIVALTFTNKAAEEMRRRVESLVGGRVLVSTFHSFCTRILRKDIARMGISPSFSIYDRADSRRLMRRIVKELELDTKTYAPSRMLDRLGVLKEQIIGVDEFGAHAVGVKEKALADMYRLYQTRLAESEALDFDDLLLKTIELFRACPEVLKEYQDTCLHLLVDEYQDTNLPQHLIARALQGKHHNITAVGDPDQMIYGWRGARLNNILEFADDFPGTHIVALERNYRSSANILRAASACISSNELRYPKKLWTEEEDGESVRALEFDDSFAEADWVVARGRELMAQGVSPCDLAVFYRTRSQSLPFEDAFSSQSLPYQVVDGVGFFQRRVVKDLRAYMQLIVNPSDDEAFLRVVNTPARGVGAKTLEALRREAGARGTSLLRAARAAQGIASLGTRAKNALKTFCTLYDELVAIASQPVTHVLRGLVEKTKYVENCPGEDVDDVREIVDQFLGYADRFEKTSESPDLRAFLEQAALVNDIDGWDSSADAVCLMTLHSAKGLEFDAVFVTGLEEQLLPHPRALRERHYGSEAEAIEEERRLLHVGMTRARKQLFLTCSRSRFVQGKARKVGPSRFLIELPDDCVVSELGRPLCPKRGAQSEFGREADAVVRAKRTSPQLQMAEEEGAMQAGAQVRHAMFGEGEILEVAPQGKHYKLKVDFGAKGVMTILMPAAEV